MQRDPKTEPKRQMNQKDALLGLQHLQFCIPIDPYPYSRSSQKQKKSLIVLFPIMRGFNFHCQLKFGLERRNVGDEPERGPRAKKIQSVEGLIKNHRVEVVDWMSQGGKSVYYCIALPVDML